MSVQDFFNCTCDVYQSQNPQSLSAGMKVVPVLKASAIPCRITDDNAGQEIIADAKNVKISHTIYTLYTGFLNGDTCVETTPGSSQDRFRFLGPKVRRAQGGIPQFLALLFQEINN
jgi:hypothetical protein